MNRYFFLFGVPVIILVITSMYVVRAADQDEITSLRTATAKFQHTIAARAAGYDLVHGLDNCFQNYGVGGKGFHYINTSLVDITLDVEHPEALIFAPDAKGGIHLGAAGYIVPAAAWDAEHSAPPQLLGQQLHFYERLDSYVLYVWIWQNNPAGMYEDWNPAITCPAARNSDAPVPGRWR